MDIRSRAQLLRPVRHFLDARQPERGPVSGAPGFGTDNPAVPQPGVSGAAIAGPAAPDEPIAVVGMGCRFPDADDPAALLDVVTGKAQPEGKLPFELPSSMQEVEAQRSDIAHDTAHPLYRFGYGLRYGATR